MTSEHRKVQREVAGRLEREPRHPCVVRTCGKSVRASVLMCGTHWRRVPGELRELIMKGRGRRDAEWVNACQVARRHVEEEEARRG